MELGEQWACGLTEVIYNSSHSNFIDDNGGSRLNSLTMEADGEKEVIKFPRTDFISLEHLFTYLISLVKSHHLGQLMVNECVDVIRKKMLTADTMPFKAAYEDHVLTNTLTYDNHIIRFAVKDYESVSELFDEIEKLAVNKRVRVELLARALALLMNNINHFYKMSIHRQDQVLAHIYVDVIESVLSGDVSAKTIRIAELDRKGGHLIFNPVYYHKLSQFNFDTILVEIRDDDGDYVNFRTSEKPTLLVLHFKRVV